MIKCSICGKEFKTYCSLSRHITDHNITKQEYYDTYIEPAKNNKHCPICHNENRFISITKGYVKGCCASHVMMRKDVQEKYKKTTLERYGVENISQLPETKSKKRETFNKRYNVNGVFGLNSFKDKIKEKYNVDNISQLESIKEKKRRTTTEHYGVAYPSQSKEIVKKQEQTMLKRYGYKNISQSPVIKKKKIETMHRNNSFTKHKKEEIVYNRLKKIFQLVKTQYKTNIYPFKCDFYVPELDLYIECNFHWTHGNRFFDKNNVKDLEILEVWKNRAKHNKYYQVAIDIWTKRDLLKLQTAIDNNLNYVVWFNMEQFNDWINRYEEKSNRL